MLTNTIPQELVSKLIEAGIGGSPASGASLVAIGRAAAVGVAGVVVYSVFEDDVDLFFDTIFGWQETNVELLSGTNGNLLGGALYTDNIPGTPAEAAADLVENLAAQVSTGHVIRIESPGFFGGSSFEFQVLSGDLLSKLASVYGAFAPGELGSAYKNLGEVGTWNWAADANGLARSNDDIVVETNGFTLFEKGTKLALRVYDGDAGGWINVTINASDIGVGTGKTGNGGVGGGDQFIFGTAGDDRLSANGSGKTYILAGDGSDVVQGSAGADHILLESTFDSSTNLESASPNEAYANDGDDHVMGGGGVDRIFGGNGNDRIVAGRGSDFVDGGEDNDTIFGDTEVENSFNSQGANDKLLGGGGSDTIHGGEGNDYLDGGTEGDRLYGGDGDDKLIGGDGIDTLVGGNGADILVTGRVDSVFETQAGHGEVVDGGTGTDYLVVTGAIGETVVVAHGDKQDRLLIHTRVFGDVDGNPVAADTDLFALLGGVAVYTLHTTGSETGDNFPPPPPNTDPAQYTQYLFADAPYAGNGPSSVSNRGVEYRLWGDGKLDVVLTDGNDGTVMLTLTINDFRNGDYGIRLHGTIVLPFHFPSQPFDMEPWKDNMAEYDAAVRSITTNAEAYSLEFDGATLQRLVATQATEGGTLHIAIAGLENNDRLDGNDVAEIIRGNGGNDVLTGRGGNDSLFGGDGNDRILTGAGADVADGGDGIDTLDYGRSSAAIHGDLGAGVFTGGDAEGDQVSGFERVYGSRFDDVIVGDEVANRFVGNAGNDALFGLAAMMCWWVVWVRIC